MQTFVHANMHRIVLLIGQVIHCISPWIVFLTIHSFHNSFDYFLLFSRFFFLFLSLSLIVFLSHFHVFTLLWYVLFEASSSGPLWLVLTTILKNGKKWICRLPSILSKCNRTWKKMELALHCHHIMDLSITITAIESEQKKFISIFLWFLFISSVWRLSKLIGETQVKETHGHRADATVWMYWC